MDLSILSGGPHVAGHIYQWKMALAAMAAVVALPWLVGRLLLLSPAMRHTWQLNKAAAAQRLVRDNYQPIQNRSMLWGLIGQLVLFALVIPFVATVDAQPWWRIALDSIVILMFYDFFYYLTHRFVFHDGGIGPGPLMWVHSVHHRQHNPCRQDSSYLHPIETLIGTLLFAASIAVLGAWMGSFHVITLVIVTIAFAYINLHNHDLMEADHFPFRYLKHASDMHHVHHRRFNAGNYATITLFYDWLFGTYDTGNGWGKNRKVSQRDKARWVSETEREAAGA